MRFYEDIIVADPAAKVAFGGYDADTYIHETADDTVEMYVGGVQTLIYEAGPISMPNLSSDDNEDHVLAIDDATGLLSKRSVSSLGIGGGDVSAGTFTQATGQVAFWTATADEIIGSNDLLYDTTNHSLIITGSSPNSYMRAIDTLGTTHSTLNASYVSTWITGVRRMHLDPGASDGATAEAHSLDTRNAFTTAGAVLLNIANAGVWKMEVFYDGVVNVAAGGDYQIDGVSIVGGAIGGGWTVASNIISPTVAGDNVRMNLSERIYFRDVNQYIYCPSSQYLHFGAGTAGTDAFRMSGTINLSYRHINPSTSAYDLGSASAVWGELHVVDAYIGNASTSIKMDGSTNLSFTDAISGTVTLASLVSGSSLWTADTNGITYTAGNVGIGVASHSGYDLTVEGTSWLKGSITTAGGVTASGSVTTLGGTGYSTLWFHHGSSNYTGIRSIGPAVYPELRFERNNGTTNLTTMTLDADGNVGIGDITPSYKLDVNGSGRFVNNLSVTSSGTAYFILDGNTTASSIGTLLRMISTTAIRARGVQFERDDSAAEWFAGIGYNVADDYVIGYDATSGQPEYAANAILRITPAGRVGIGADPGAQFDAYGTIAAPPEVRVSNIGGTWVTDVSEVGRYSFYSRDVSGIGVREVASIVGMSTLGGSAGGFGLIFKTSVINTVAVETMRIDDLGYLRISGLAELGGTTNNSVLQWENNFDTASNHVKQRVWSVRKATGTTWTTSAIHDGISVDSVYYTPGTDTRTWYERYPNIHKHSWGSNAVTYMSLDTSGLDVTGDLSVTSQIVTGSLTPYSTYPISVYSASIPKLSLILDSDTDTGDPSLNFFTGTTPVQKSVIGYNRGTDTLNILYGGSMNNVTGIIIHSSGDIGLNATTNVTSGYKLELFSTDNKGRAADWTATSDIRLKTNITPFGSVLPGLTRLWNSEHGLSVYNRRFLNDKNKPIKGYNEEEELGFIAHEMEAEFPVIVHGSEEEYFDISYMRLGAIAAAGVAELKDEKDREIADLKIEIENLKLAVYGNDNN